MVFIEKQRIFEMYKYILSNRNVLVKMRKEQ